jgi:hypothetical protein
LFWLFVSAAAVSRTPENDIDLIGAVTGRHFVHFADHGLFAKTGAVLLR